MADFRNYLSCSIGDVTFTVSQCSHSPEPQVKDNFGLCGERVSIDLTGWIEGTDAADLAANIEALRVACVSAGDGGADVVVWGVGGPPVSAGGTGDGTNEECRIVASLCAPGYPKVTPTIGTSGDGAGYNRRSVKLKAEGLYGLSDDWKQAGLPPLRITVRVDEEPGGRKVETQDGVVGTRRASGSIIGMPAADVFSTVLLPDFVKKHPAWDAKAIGPNGQVGLGWIISHTFTQNPADKSGTYNLKAEQITEQLPVDDTVGNQDGPTNAALDGAVTEGQTRDEQGRMTKSYGFEGTVKGDPRKVYEAIRAKLDLGPGKGTAARAVILRESYQVSRTKGIKLSASFTVLAAADGSQVVEFSQEIKLEGESPLKASRSYPGLPPIIYYAPSPARKATQTGRLTSIGKFIGPPGPAFAGSLLSAPEQVGYRRLDDWTFETTWSYEFLQVNGWNLDAAKQPNISRPPPPAPPLV